MMRCNYKCVPSERALVTFIDFAVSGIEPGTIWPRLLSDSESMYILSFPSFIKYSKKHYPPILSAMAEIVALSSLEATTLHVAIEHSKCDLCN